MSFDPTADLPFSIHQAEATILAALKFYQAYDQGTPDNRDNYIHDLATAGDAVVSLDDGGIDDVYEAIIAGRLEISEHQDYQNQPERMVEVEAAEIIARLRVYVAKFGDDDGELLFITEIPDVPSVPGPALSLSTGTGDFGEHELLINDEEGNGVVLDGDEDIELLRRIVRSVEADVLIPREKVELDPALVEKYAEPWRAASATHRRDPSAREVRTLEMIDELKAAVQTFGHEGMLDLVNEIPGVASVRGPVSRIRFADGFLILANDDDEGVEFSEGDGYEAVLRVYDSVQMEIPNRSTP